MCLVMYMYKAERDDLLEVQQRVADHCKYMHIHVYAYTCICVCIYIYIYIHM